MSTRMEQPFYHDDAFGQPESAAYGYSPKFLKQNLTLNLSDPNSSLKPHLRNKGAEGILTSPDVGLLKLASPELERLIIQSSNGMVTTTPTPTQFLCPRNVTDEQEGFAEGFVKALEELHKQNVLPTAATCPGTPPAGTTPTPAPGPAPTSAPTPTPTPGSSLPNSAPPYNSNLHQEPPVYANLSNFNPNAIGGYSGDMNYTPSQQQPQHQHHHHHHHHQHQQHQHPPPRPAPRPGRPAPRAAAPQAPGAEGRASDCARDVRGDAAAVAHRHGVAGAHQGGEEAHEEPHRRLQVQEEEAGAHRQTGGQGQEPQVAELGAVLHRQPPAGASGPTQAEGHEPRHQRLSTHVNP
uniref:Jun proto-oncogene, AP-1 transcription factor subunit n=1 Tax=Callorhinchus milii TaxID=7868 RepID=A0A4W3JVC4_CALMI